MWVMEAFQDLDFGVEVLFQFLVELREIDRFDCYESSGSLVLSSVDSCKASLADLIFDAEGTDHFVTRPRSPGSRR